MEKLCFMKKNCKEMILALFLKRIFDSVEDSIHLAKELESTGIRAIAVHGRTASQKSTEPVNKGMSLNSYNFFIYFDFQIKKKINIVNTDTIRYIAENVKIPVIANGGSDVINCHDDIEKFKTDSGASSVMIARGALKNMSIFRKEGKKSTEKNMLVKKYVLCLKIN